MTRHRGASRGGKSTKNNQNTRISPSEAPSRAISQATHLATPTDDKLRFSAQESLLANFLQGGEVGLATLRDRVADALAGLQRSFAAVRLQRAARRVLARRRYVENLCTLRAQRVQDLEEQGRLEGSVLRDHAVGGLAGLQRSFAAVRLQRAARCGLAKRRYVVMLCASRAQRAQGLDTQLDGQGKLESIELRKQQLFQAVEGLQDAAGEWLVARAVQQDEGEPAWLVQAGHELEHMLRQWQQRQEERLEGGGRTQQREQEGSPTGVTYQGQRATDGVASPAEVGGSVGLDQVIARRRGSGVVQVAGKQGGGRQRKEKIARNAAARDAATGGGRGSQAEHAQAGDAQAVQAEQDRMERQLRAEVEEARQLAAAIQASRDHEVGRRSWGAAEGDDDIDEQFRELCSAAGVAPEDIYRPALQQPLAAGTAEAAVFRRKCRRAGVTVACGGQREQLKRLHIARARSELFMRHKLGANWRRVAERNLEAARARYAARQWLDTEAQCKGGGGV